MRMKIGVAVWSRRKDIVWGSIPIWTLLLVTKSNECLELVIGIKGLSIKSE